MVGTDILRCMNIAKSNSNIRQTTKGNNFSILYFLTELYLFCLDQLNKCAQCFPDTQEKILLTEIKSKLQSLKSGLIKFDSENFSYVRVALRDCQVKQDANFKVFLVEYVLSSYKRISKNILDKNDYKNLDGPSLEEWKVMLKNHEENVKVSPGSQVKPYYPIQISEYFKVRRDVDSLHKVYSIIKSTEEILKTEPTLKESKLVLERVLNVAGECMKNTGETCNLSDDIRNSLRDEGIPVELFSDVRNLLTHHVIPVIDPDKDKISELFRDSLLPIENIIQSKIGEIEKTFIKDLIDKVRDQTLTTKLVEHAGRQGIKGIITLTESKSSFLGELRTTEAKRSAKQIHDTAKMMRSTNFSLRNKTLPLSSQDDFKSKISSSFAKYISGCKLDTYNRIRDQFWKDNKHKLDYDEYKSTREAVVSVAKLIDFLQYGGTEEDSKIIDNLFTMTETLKKMTVKVVKASDSKNTLVNLNEELLKYFHEDSFKRQLTYFAGDEAKNLNELLKSIEGNKKYKKRLVRFFQSIIDQKDIVANYLEPNEYEKLLNGLHLDTKAKEDFLLFSVEWRKKKCIDLLEQSPPALKKIYDAIIKCETIDSQVLKNFVYQTRKKLSDFVTENRIIQISSAWGNILKEVKAFYLSDKEIKYQVDVLRNLRTPYAVESQFINIYTILERTGTVHNKEHYVIRQLRNHLAHAEGENESFGEELMKLMKKAAGRLPKPEDSADITVSSFSRAVDDAMAEDKLPKIMEVVGETVAKSNSRTSNQNLNRCVRRGRQARSISICLFTKEDVEIFSKEKVDENKVDMVKIDSEKFLNYVKSSQDEEKNSQLIEFIGNKGVEGEYKHTVDMVSLDQGYERYIQNERIKDLYSDIAQRDASTIKPSKLKIRLINAAGRIQLIRGVHGAITSCTDGTAIDCGLNVGGLAWSFASQPIENIIVRTAPKVVTSAGHVLGKMIPGALGKQAQFLVTFTGVRFGSRIAKGVAGGVGGIFDVIDIGRSAKNLIECIERENSNKPCSDKEIRDELASISFSGVSFISGVGLTAASMPVVGVAVGFGLMVGQGVYSGISNIIEYREMYDTTDSENWSIFWRTLLFQPMASDVKQLTERSGIVNMQANKAWKALGDSPSSVFAYAVGLVKIDHSLVSLLEKTWYFQGISAFFPSHAKITMSRKGADSSNISRVTPKSIQYAEMICLPQFSGEDYEKNIRQSVPTAVYYCENAIVVVDKRKEQHGTTVFYDLADVDKGTIVGSNTLNNHFLISSGQVEITGGNNVVNRFSILSPDGFMGKITGGSNATNIIDLSQSKKWGYVVVEIELTFVHNEERSIAFRINLGSVINGPLRTDNNDFRYYYIGRQNNTDVVLCKNKYSQPIDSDIHSVFIDSGGGLSKSQKDTIHNCKKVAILPYTRVTGEGGNYTFYIKTTGYRSKDLYSEIDVESGGTVIFPEIALLNDCNEITYYSNYLGNTLYLKVELDKGNMYTLEIKNYINKNSHQPNFIFIDKYGSNIVLKVEKPESLVSKINSFELHTEHSLESIDAAEIHYKRLLGDERGYKVFGVVRTKPQGKNYSKFQSMIFGSSANDLINLDQTGMFVRGGNGSDIYVINGNTQTREIIVDNYSDDEMLDVLLIPEVPKKFLVQRCDLHFRTNNIHIQVRNYAKENSYRHLIVMNGNGETFIPYIQSMTCVETPEENDKLVHFIHPTPTQNAFLLSKDFQGNHVVIDSCLDEIVRYREKDDLLLVREGEVPFIVKIEDFYNDRSKWEDVSFLLWNDGNFYPYSGLYLEVNGVMDYRVKLNYDYQETIKEYDIDFTQSVNITHNQDDTLTSVGENEERVGVIILKNITTDRILVSSSDRDLVFSDKVSKYEIKVKNWNDSESYRIYALEFDLGLETITIPRLNEFGLSNLTALQDLINKSLFAFHQKKLGCNTNIYDKDEGVATLQCAAENGRIEIVKYLIEERGIDFHVIDRFGQTLLHLAARGGSLELVKYLTEEKKADTSIKNTFGQTPLHTAIANGNFGIAKYLIEENKSDINEKTIFIGQTPLHFAADVDSLEFVKYLVEEKNADFDVKNNFRQTPLYFAAANGNLGLVKYLIEEKHADINTMDMSRQTPLHLAAANGNLRVVKYLIEVKNADINTKDIYEKVPLHLAAANGNLGVVKYLIEDKHADMNAMDISRETPLHLAAANGNLEVMKYLIEEKSADTNTKSKFEQTPLHYAAANGSLAIVNYLIEEKNADYKAKDSSGKTPLHLAAKSGSLELVKNLIEERNIDNNMEDATGQTPLHFAATNGSLGVVKYLIEVKNSDINRKDATGKTPLHLAAINGHLGVVKYLTEERNADINVKDSSSRTPLSLSRSFYKQAVVAYLEKKMEEQEETSIYLFAQDNRKEIVRIFIERVASIQAPNINGHKDLSLLLWQRSNPYGRECSYIGLVKCDTKLKTGSVNVLVHFIPYYNYLGPIQEIMERAGRVDFRIKNNRKLVPFTDYYGYLNTVDELIEEGFDVNAKNDQGLTPLHLAAYYGHLNVVDRLIEEGSYVNAKTNQGLTSLHLAAYYGHLNVVESLIYIGADVNDKNNQGLTPLHFATYYGHFNVVETLIEDRSDVNSKNIQGLTPLHLAAFYGHLNIVERLIEKGSNLSATNNLGLTPLHLADQEGHSNVVKQLAEKEATVKETSKQRKRRHHHGDHTRHKLSRKLLAVDSGDQPKVAVSSGERQSSWVNDLFGWVKSSVGRLLSDKSEGTARLLLHVDGQLSKASVNDISLARSTQHPDGTDKIQGNGGFFRNNIEVNSNPKRVHERKIPFKFQPQGRSSVLEMGDHYLSQIDFNGTIMLFDSLIRRFTGQNYISTADQTIPPLEAQGYALTITKGFDEVVEQAGLISGVSMHRLNIDYMTMEEEITRKIMSGEFNEISGVLSLCAEKACKDGEAGKISLKKFNTFMATLNNMLNVTLDQLIQQMFHNENNLPKTDNLHKIKKLDCLLELS